MSNPMCCGSISVTCAAKSSQTLRNHAISLPNLGLAIVWSDSGSTSKCSLRRPFGFAHGRLVISSLTYCRVRLIVSVLEKPETLPEYPPPSINLVSTVITHNSRPGLKPLGWLVFGLAPPFMKIRLTNIAPFIIVT